VSRAIEVVAAVIEAGGKVLCVQRGTSRREYISCKWEFPGGKVEADEDAVSALSREIEEELRVSIRVREHLLTVEHVYPDFALRMHAYRCDLTGPTDAVVLTEHVDSRWLEAGSPSFVELDWAAADLPIVDLLHRGGARDRLRAPGP